MKEKEEKENEEDSQCSAGCRFTGDFAGRWWYSQAQSHNGTK